MNCYETTFFANCPSNGIKIKYTLHIRTHEVIKVECLLAELQNFQVAFHEDIADVLHQKFAGEQILTASHHGVQITTIRK